MTVSEIIAALPLTVITAPENPEQEVKGGYASDLLSNVMGQAGAGFLWVTMQGHQNIVAVASLLGLAGIILAGGAKPDEETIRKAGREKIALLTTELSTFEISGRLYQLGISGQC
ncbi:MAG: DRTGG domain-containing protein [Negativicutes bacterium]|nr:DRTGG domain-containing protein [Negativicutes bacterium]